MFECSLLSLISRLIIQADTKGSGKNLQVVYCEICSGLLEIAFPYVQGISQIDILYPEVGTVLDEIVGQEILSGIVQPGEVVRGVVRCPAAGLDPGAEGIAVINLTINI